MKLRLPRKPQAGARIKALQGSALNALHSHQSSAVRRCQLFVDHIGRFTGRHKEVTIQPLKVTLDFFPGDDRLDTVNGRGMTLGGKPRPFLSMHTFHLEVAIVESVDQLSLIHISEPTRLGMISY